MSQAKRRFFAPEVVQTSGMDCGPASLKCLLEGMGLPISYGRLREACQTDVDGTSIDTMEEIAVQLGLDAEQIMIPVDHLLLSDAETLPAIVVIRLPNGFTHFVVVWRVHAGRFVQIMDPAVGRRWLTVSQFLNMVFRHSFVVPAAGWREWAGSEDFLAPLRTRLRELGIKKSQITQLEKDVLADEAWSGLAALDAATRLTRAIVRSGGIKKGKQAAHILTNFMQKTAVDPQHSPIPEAYWSVRSTEPDEDGDAQLVLTGAVLVRGRGLLSKTKQTAVPEPLSPELRAALDEKPPKPALAFWRLLREDGYLTPLFLLLALLLTAVGVVVEALLLRGLFDLGQSLATGPQRLGAMTAVVLFSFFMLALRHASAKTILGLGRGLEIRLRIAFLQKIPKLKDQYFRSRPISDMAQRSHAIYRLRNLPDVVARVLLAFFTIICVTVSLIFLSPQNSGFVIALGVLTAAIPFIFQPTLTERDMRFRTHLGGLSRFFLDGMLGLVPIRTHGAETAVRREHETLLIAWARAAFDLHWAAIIMLGTQLIIGYGLAIAILWNHIRLSGSTDILLLVYWLLLLPALALEMGIAARQYPSLRNTTLRLLEPLGAPEEAVVSAPSSGNGDRFVAGVSLALKGVTVQAAGHTILQGIDLQIEAGERVAIVGSSGAGKSSLVGLLLGWQRAASGQFFVNGQPLDEAHLSALRQVTAWVDPSVQLWNQSLLNNLRYGNDPDAATAVAIEQAELISVLGKLPDGLQTALGESGGLVSGGEGQRVRLGRALLRNEAKLVILDEAFRGLGLAQRKRLLKQARSLWQDATFLCITHDVSETLSFERVLVMDHGRLVEDGSPSDLAAQPSSRYAALLQAERDVRQQVWADEQWCKMRLENGKLVMSQQEAVHESD